MNRSLKLFLIPLFAAAAAWNVVAAGKPGGSATASATAFLPNPVADLGDQSLTDQKDADYAALAPAYHPVTLTNLDGSGYLRGDWAFVVSETGNPARRRTTSNVSASAAASSPASTTSRSASASTSGAPTTRFSPRRRTSCASVRAAWTMPRTPR
jgi:hypothetical protein